MAKYVKLEDICKFIAKYGDCVDDSYSIAYPMREIKSAIEQMPSIEIGEDDHE